MTPYLHFTKLLPIFLLLIQLYAGYGLEPRIIYIDGDQRWDSCLAGLKRSVSGESGILISHTQYGATAYNGSKNCFLTLTVPIGYRLRLRALEFVVYNSGEERSCEKDTLHVFDHELQPLDPGRMDQLTIVERAPGKILGEFCGHFPRAKATQSPGSAVMAESSHNALTLWWHTDSNLSRSSQVEGFRLLWSAFRTRPELEKCEATAEFTCNTKECIPISLGCNSQADCSDESDLLTDKKVAHGCERKFVLIKVSCSV